MPSAGWSRLVLALVQAIMDYHRARPAEQHPAMLQRVVRVQQAGPQCAHFRTIEKAAQDLIPPVCQHCHIIVDEEEQRRVHLHHRLIIQTRPVERFIDRKDFCSFFC
jgi:hypothetical protein